ncbi:MAG: T9SS type A sorting domain-containing protein, partial [Candidatus Krumholzibacteriia bacterium]
PLPIGERAPVDRLVADPGCAHAADVWDHIDPDEKNFGGRYWKIEEDGEGNRFFLSDGDEPGPGGLDVLSAGTDSVLNLRADLLGGSAIGAIAFETTSGPWTKAYLGVNNAGQDGLVLWRNSDDLFVPGEANFEALQLGGMTVGAYRDIAVDPANRSRLWVGTGASLFEYDTVERDTLLTLGVQTGAAARLVSPDLQDLLIDDLGNLWVATVNGLNRISLRDSVLEVDAFSTRAKIAELNEAAAQTVGRLYDPMQSIAPLPSPKVNSLAYDASRRRLHMATDAGIATVDVGALGAGIRIPIEKAFVFPNPVRVLQGQERIFLADVNLPARVKIYNLEGEVVFEKTVTDENEEIWDLRIFVSRSGQGGTFFDATSGIYMVRIDTSDGTKVAPLVVIR